MSFATEMTPEQTLKTIQINSIHKTPIFIWGPPGIGKSEIVREAANKLGMGFVDIRLSQKEPSSLSGIPHIVENARGEKIMQYSHPSQMPYEGEKTVVFLDELPNAAPLVQSAAYELILDRRLGEYKLPEDCIVIAAGNRLNDKGGTFKMAKPLQNRFIHVEMKADYEEWKTWAIKKQIHPFILGYLENNTQDLMDFDPSNTSHAYPTPRSWVYVSNIMHAYEKTFNDLGSLDEKDNNMFFNTISGAVGVGVNAKFSEYLNGAYTLPKVKDIVNGKVTTIKKDKTHLHFTLVNSLCYEIKNMDLKRINGEITMDEYAKIVNTILDFIKNNCSLELCTVALRNLVNIMDVHIDVNWKGFSFFAKNFSKIMVEEDA